MGRPALDAEQGELSIWPSSWALYRNMNNKYS